MVEGIAGQAAGDSHKGAKPGENNDLNRAAMANIAAELYGHKPTSHDLPLRQAQATSAGPDGTYGAPVIGGTDTIERPATQAAATAAPKPYSLTRDGSTTGSDFKVVPYDIDKEVGGSPFANYPDYATRIIGTAVGSRMAYKHHEVEMNKGLNFIVPSYSEQNGVAAATIDDMSVRRVPAHSFMNVEVNRLARLAKGISPNPELRNDAEQVLVDRLLNARALREATNGNLMTGNRPAMKLDFSVLDGDTRTQKGFNHVVELEKAQDALLDERSKFVSKLKNDAITTHNSEVHAARMGFVGELGALIGGQAANIGVDYLIPRNRTSWVTTAVDLAAPIVAMATPMTRVGKWAPLVQIGIITGAHTLSHVTMDTQVDESK